MVVTYTYNVLLDTLTGSVCERTLDRDIRNSSIGTNFDGLIVEYGDSQLKAIFTSSLSAPDIATLDSIIATHDGDDCPPAAVDSSTGYGTPPGSDGYASGNKWINNSTGDIFIFSAGAWRLVNPNLDGYASSSAVQSLSQTEQEHHTQHSIAINTILGDIDGYIPLNQKGAINGVATLDAGGKVPSAQMPAISLPEVHVVLDDTERLALDVQEGDEVIQTEDGYHYIYDGYDWFERPGANGDVAGPGSATDNAIARFDGTTGKVVQNSSVTIDDSGNISTPGNVDGRDISADGSTLDSHTSNTSNPHNTDVGNLGSGTLAELNSTITDATLDDSSATRDPNTHASSHEDGGSDELTAQNLGSGAAASGKIMESDGSGGWNLIDTPTGTSTSDRVLLAFGAEEHTVSDSPLTTSGGGKVGYKITNDYTFKRFSVLTDGYNDNLYVVTKNGELAACVAFNNEKESLVTDINISYSAGDILDAYVQHSSININSPYTDDIETLLLCHIDGDDASTRNITNSASNNTGLGARAFGATLGATGKFNKAADFDGTNDYIEILHQDSMDVQDCTVEFWFNSDSVGDNKTLFSKDSSGYDTGGHLTITQSGANDIVVRSQTTSSQKEHEITDADILSGTWYHVAVVLGTGGMKLFLDGVLKHTDNSWTQGLNGNREPIALGAGTTTSDDGLVTPLSDYFDGKICELRISNTRRYESGFTPSASQFSSDANTVGLWHFDETSGSVVAGSSGETPNLMMKAGNSFPTIDSSTKKFGTDSIKMNNSTSDFLQMIHTPDFEANEVTVETWLNVFDSGDGMVFAKGDGSTEGGLEIKFINTNAHLEVTYYGATTSRTIVTSNNSFPTNEWHHVAVTLDSNTFEVFIDGASEGSESLTTDYQNVWANNKEDVYWAQKANGSEYLQAYYDEMRISNAVRNFSGGATAGDISLLVELEG